MYILSLLLIYFLAAHWIADYPLQGDYLAKAKQSGPMRVYHLIAHAGIHGGFVALISGSPILGFFEWVAHAFIDELKVRNKISFAVDQTLHIGCKVFYVLLIGAFRGTF